MSDTYDLGYGAQPQGGVNNAVRNNLASVIMNIRRPPPMPPAQQIVAQQPPGVLPQSQPAAQGPPGPPTGPLGGMPGPYGPGVNLPGVMPPGQLPAGMNPQGVVNPQGIMGQPPAGPTAMTPPGGLRQSY